MQDRLRELKAADDVEVELEPAKKPDILEHMKLYEPIKQGLEVITNNVQKIRALKESDKTVVDERARKEVMKQLDTLIQHTTNTAKDIKSILDRIKQDNAKFLIGNSDSAKGQIRTNAYQTHVRQFHNVMNQYNSVSHQFQQSIQDRTRRQIKYVDPKLPDNLVQEIIQSGQAQDVILTGLTEDVVQDIQARHNDVLRLERDILEVHELFRDLATLVDLQQESLDIIETRIANAKNYTEQAAEELEVAVTHQNAARKKSCCLFIVLVAIVMVIVAPILWKNFYKSV
jgi:t-SNARE complex subunit (syntaxin)